MKKRLLELPGQVPILNIVSYGRSGPRSLTRSQREEVARTAHRVPEVMIKVSGGARTLAGVEQSLQYYGRNGKVGMEMDTGEHLGAKGFEGDLVRDWNLDIEAHQRQNARAVRAGRRPPKLVHNIIFSMPAGTPADKVLKAVRKLMREEFAFTHRYAMVLHTNEPHPHVHVVLKAVSERGVRFNIRKATLRQWREQFASNLRELGVAANATERAVRGQPRTSKSDGIYRTAQRGESSYVRDLARRAVADKAMEEIEEGKAALLKTRKAVVDGWRAVSGRLRADGYHDLAEHVDSFVERMPPVQTDREAILEYGRSPLRPRDREPPAKTR
jgi:hypothetical protein